MTTLVEVLERRLRQLGVSRVYGAPLGDLDHIGVEDPDLAVLLADADGRLGHVDGSGRLGAAFLDGAILHLSSEPGGTAVLQHVTTPDELMDLLADPPGIDIPGTSALELDLDLSAPASGLEIDRTPTRAPVVTLDPAMSSLKIVLLVGPGVVRSAAVDDVRELARRGGWGVVSTWGARGVERWDSPFDWGTIGLQERDVELSGLLDADVIVTSGLDPHELDTDVLASKLVQDVPPRQLGVLLKGWSASRRPPERSAHHEVLAGALVPMYESEDVPLTPPRAVLHLTGAIPEGGVVIGTPGASGFWLARSYPTSVPESLCVPATSVPGFVAAAALVCTIEGRPYVAVADQVPDQPEGVDVTTKVVMELADRFGMGVELQMWGDAGADMLTSSSDHVDLTLQSVDRTGSGSVSRSVMVPVATDGFDEVSRVMGPPIAWGGPPSWPGPGSTGGAVDVPGSLADRTELSP